MKLPIILSLIVPMVAFSSEVGLDNTSFETFGPDGKPIGWTLTGNFRIEKGAGHNGNGGLVWSSDKTCGKLHYASQLIRGVNPGDMLEYSLLGKKEGFKTAANQGAVFSIEMLDENNKWICAKYAVFHNRSPDLDWIELRGSGEVPVNAKSALVRIYVSGDSTGTVRWDNLTVRKFEPKPVPMVCTSVYKALAKDGVADFHALLRRTPELRDAKIEVKFRWTDSAGKARETPASRIGIDEAYVELPVADMKLGKQSIVAEMWNEGKLVGSSSCDFTRVAEMPKRMVWIDEHGRCIVNGQPFFPLGMYWNPHDTKSGESAAYYAGPFNCSVHYEMMSPARLDYCQSKGIMTFSRIDLKLWKTDHQKFVQTVNATKDHPALLAWYLGDELDVGSAPTLTAISREMNELDPGHPTYYVHDRTYDLRNFCAGADIIGTDHYPVAEKPVRCIDKFIKDARVALFNARPQWGVPQAFAWCWYPRDGEKNRFPTVAEMRSMFWQHIVNDSKGLLSFAFNCYFYPRNKQDWRPLWAANVQVHEEIRRLIPVLLSVDPAPEAKSDNPDMIAKVWRKDGDLYVAVCNLAEKPLYAAVDLSDGKWKVVGTEVGTPASMDGERKVRFYLDPIGVSVVRLANVL